MASSMAASELKRERTYTLVILVVLFLAFCTVFKPVRRLPSEEFVPVYFSYRFAEVIGPGQAQKDDLRTKVQKSLLEKDIAPDSRITFPTMHEVKIRVPLQDRSEVAEVNRNLKELVGEAADGQFGELADGRVDTTGFREEPLATFGKLGLYRPRVHLKLGLDLQGGVHLVLKARTQNVQHEYKLADTAADLIAALDALEGKPTEPEAAVEPTSDETTVEGSDGQAAADEGGDDATAEATDATAAEATGEEPSAETEAEPADAAETTTAPDGGQPIRMAQATDDLDGDDPDAADSDVVDDEDLSADETTSPEEAQLLSDDTLRGRVQEALTAFTVQLRAKYGERIGDVHSEVIGSNVIVFRTFVEPDANNAESLRSAQANIIASELKQQFPGSKPLGEPEQLDIPRDAMQQVKDVITRRVDRLGVAEAQVQTQSNDRVVIELPGIKDPDEAVALLGTTAQLEFRKVPSRYVPRVDTIGGREVTAFTLKSGGEEVPTSLVYYEAPEFKGNKNILVGTDLASNAAVVTYDEQGAPAVSLKLKPAGAKRFDDFAQENFKEYLAIFLDREVISAPVMNARRFNGQVQISGGFDSIEEATQLKVLLNAGALPVPVDVVEQRTVSATLGADSVRQSFLAGMAGLVLVLVFMVAFFRGPGLMADFALIGYVGLTFACLSAVNATLTLPGILGLILGIGMAVDANVIVFERLKEELRESSTRPLHSCIKNSYEKAKSAIYDGNITTLMIAAVLFVMGTGPIKGFAVTLTISIICSMLSALIVTRRFQNMFAASSLGRNRAMYRS